VSVRNTAETYPNNIPLENVISPSWAEWKVHHSQTVSVDDVRQHLPHLCNTKLASIPDEHLIFLWASSATLTLEGGNDKNNNGASDKPTVLDDSGNVIGEMGRMSEEHWASGDYAQGTHEFIVVGSRRNSYCKPMLLVLQIEWQDGIAYRINFGEVEEEAWIRARRAWKLIALG
jgi:hypothetical protein